MSSRPWSRYTGTSILGALPKLPEQAALQAQSVGGVGEHRGRRGNEGALFELYVHAREGLGIRRKGEGENEQEGGGGMGSADRGRK